MMRLKASKDSSHGFQVSSEINFLISIHKDLSTSGQTITVTSKNFELNGPSDGGQMLAALSAYQYQRRRDEGTVWIMG